MTTATRPSPAERGGRSLPGRRSLATRLTLALLGLLIVFGAVITAVTLVTIRLYVREVQQELDRDLARHLVADQLPMDQTGVRREALESIFHQLMVINPAIEVYLLDETGHILEYSAPPGRVLRERVSLEPIEALLSGSERTPILGDDPRSESGRKIFSVAPIHAARGGAVLGYLYVVLAGEQQDSMTSMVAGSTILRVGLWTVVGSVLLALAAGGFLFFRLTRRLRRLDREIAERSAGLLRTGGGDGAEPVSAGGDEIDRLQESFRKMTRRIEEQIAMLRENDRLRRELVANVSHDLRTPITHLQGYLETVLMKEDAGESLAPEERREYLEIAARQAARLGRQVSDLFELAKLDARQAPLEREVFSPAELAQDVVQKFRVAAGKRGVALELALPSGAGRTRVAADLDLVERVLDNLIDNALRHTPEGGRVEVATRPAAGAVEMEVRDTGPGIAAEDLPRVFERFYRSSRRPGEDEAGTGLGLAIARRAVELHGSELTCESEPGEGARFRFRLPAVS